MKPFREDEHVDEEGARALALVFVRVVWRESREVSPRQDKDVCRLEIAGPQPLLEPAGPTWHVFPNLLHDQLRPTTGENKVDGLEAEEDGHVQHLRVRQHWKRLIAECESYAHA